VDHVLQIEIAAILSFVVHTFLSDTSGTNLMEPTDANDLQAADLGISTDSNRQFAKKQLDYILGDSGRSFVIGYGSNPPTHPHHRSRYVSHFDVTTPFPLIAIYTYSSS
jgi:hypothetical protein